MEIKNIFKNTDIAKRKEQQAELHRKCVLLLQTYEGE